MRDSFVSPPSPMTVAPSGTEFTGRFVSTGIVFASDGDRSSTAPWFASQPEVLARRRASLDCRAGRCLPSPSRASVRFMTVAEQLGASASDSEVSWPRERRLPRAAGRTAARAVPRADPMRC
mmetsp:Transcript_11535/g.24728  ORF Transcript_11535/g.24728 Transcript_11535/m.24728 type:complete len:122 (-) Transcript_11535:56-421(-)